MDKYPYEVKAKVFGLIEEMGQHGWMFSKAGERDFSRRRKLPFDRLIKVLLGMGGDSLKNELLDAFHTILILKCEIAVADFSFWQS